MKTLDGENTFPVFVEQLEEMYWSLLFRLKRPTRHDSQYFSKMLHKMLRVPYNSRIRVAFRKDKILYNHPAL
ncbi:MAG TPA: hypothetical protein GXX35_09395 [Thermoanaerobacterales bacterium]|nr:hypothetical protein [Thermoanaerobacterales bacterium]